MTQDDLLRYTIALTALAKISVTLLVVVVDNNYTFKIYLLSGKNLGLFFQLYVNFMVNYLTNFAKKF
jgi:hypothetical protein